MKLLTQKNEIIFLFFIVLLALVLRFYDLGWVPVGFHRDESFLGYNAYSILKTGRDMTGNFLPLHLQSFLYSPAGYSYFAIPSIAAFGLKEFSVRFPAALFGTLTVLAAYFLTKQLFSIHSKSSSPPLIKGVREILGVPTATAVLLAICPWHINLSRTATENVLVVFFITLGTVLYFYWIRRKSWWLVVLSFFCFGFSLFLYQASRAFLPLFIPLLFVVFHPTPLKKHFLLPLLLFLIAIIVPVLLILSSHTLSQRIRMLSIFQQPQTQLVLNEQIREDGSSGQSPVVTRLFHNKFTAYSLTFLQTYFKHFSYDFLFTDLGLPDRYRVPQAGLLYIFELPLLIYGLWRLFLIDKRIALFLSGWILLAPLGSALTFDDVPNLQRTLIIFPALSIVEGTGLYGFWTLFTNRSFVIAARAVCIIVIFYSVSYYLHQYYINQLRHRPWYRQEGYRELVASVNTLLPAYKNTEITDFETDPAIFFLFYNAYDPLRIQLLLRQNPTEHYGDFGFNNYDFASVACPLHETAVGNPLTGAQSFHLSGSRDILYVNSGICTFPHLLNDIVTLKEIKRTDGTVVFRIQAVK